jgi:4-amino-4-deoxy-L-arabinose transferase-like glycosyltransferase
LEASSPVREHHPADAGCATLSTYLHLHLSTDIALRSETRTTTRNPPVKAKTVENNPSERIGLLLVLLIASVLRLVSLHTLPPGLHHDEAWYAVDALDVLQGHHAIYFENNTGREPLYIYLVALSYELLGPGTLQLRLVSAILGVATVAAIYLLGRELHGRVVGLIAAFVLATLFWHVSFSRLGLRAITLPLLETVAAWLLYRAAQSSSRRCWAAAGLAVGLTLFTYTASRAVPIWVGLFIAFAALVRRNDGLPRRDLLAGAAVAAVVAAGVFAPLGLYAVSHPDRFAGRMGDVSILTAAR